MIERTLLLVDDEEGITATLYRLFSKKRRAPGLFGVAVKTARRKCRLLHRRLFVQPELLTA